MTNPIHNTWLDHGEISRTRCTPNRPAVDDDDDDDDGEVKTMLANKRFSSCFFTNLYFGFHFNKSIFIVFACFDKVCNFIFKSDVFTDQTIFMIVNTAVNCVNLCHQMIQDFVSSL